ncbi:MAG: hypothetical protein K2M93_06105 [Muribaculaceae bacterium]|nr:hypothetical protein [Muribaculaceae bacterium]
MNGYENGNNGAPKGARIAFGILMILIYVGVGLLFIFNVFDIISYTVSCIIGAILILYGIFRAYRLYKGVQ